MDTIMMEFYSNMYSEKDRFSRTSAEVKFVYTCSVLECYLPGSGSVLDIGSGPGTYAKWLLECGHSVKLLDIVPPKHIEEATKIFAEIGVTDERAQAKIGNALDLPFNDCSADALLRLMGPLYHLTERHDSI